MVSRCLYPLDIEEKIDGKSVVVIAGTLQSLRKALGFSI